MLRGSYVELVPFERIVFTFGWDAGEDVPDIAPGSTVVEVILVEEEGDLLVERVEVAA